VPAFISSITAGGDGIGVAKGGEDEGTNEGESTSEDEATRRPSDTVGNTEGRMDCKDDGDTTAKPKVRNHNTSFFVPV